MASQYLDLYGYAGVGVEATIVNFAPCLVSNAYTGVAINQNLFSISPTVLKFDPTGVNVSSTNPTIISLSLISSPRAWSAHLTLHSVYAHIDTEDGRVAGDCS